MLCERCKIREANIQYTEVINGMKTEHHFCAQCAREMDFGPYSAIFDGEFPLAKLLSGLLGEEDAERKEEKMNQIVCPSCGANYGEFVKNSRFGCADCYSVFGPLMNDSIKQLQGSENHKGKRPKYTASPEAGEEATVREDMTDQELREMLVTWDARLKEALRTEEYEAAARYRDEIRALRERMGTDA